MRNAQREQEKKRKSFFKKIYKCKKFQNVNISFRFFFYNNESLFATANTRGKIKIYAKSKIKKAANGSRSGTQCQERETQEVFSERRIKVYEQIYVGTSAGEHGADKAKG